MAAKTSWCQSWLDFIDKVFKPHHFLGFVAIEHKDQMVVMMDGLFLLFPYPEIPKLATILLFHLNSEVANEAAYQLVGHCSLTGTKIHPDQKYLAVAPKHRAELPIERSHDLFVDTRAVFMDLPDSLAQLEETV